MRKRAIVFGLIFFSILGVAMTAAADEAETIGRTPPRLSFLDGQVSFWRQGAQDWTQAQINTALAPGDQLYIQGSGNLELQIGAQAYVRGGRDAQIELETQEPDFLRFNVTGGRVAFDLRSLASGRTVEVDTPHGAFIMNHEGYFRLEVSDARTTFTTRRTGRATVTAAEGDAVPMESDESVSVEGPAGNALAFQAAPPMDAWDTWNYDRTDALLEAASSRYVAPDTYGTADLDRYGSWRVLPTYGRVWVPAGVGPGWAPYSTGSWMHDPYYGWTWVDVAPWGWAPYHYGRWVYVNSYWCWAPGPIVHHAVYAPALVAFYGEPGVSVGISIGGPGVGWVALGWGEPLIPWWGRTGFIHRPWWGGWGGPRCINSRVIHHRTYVSVRDIHHYHNTRFRNALVVVDKGRFGHGRIHRRHHSKAHLKDWRPMHRAPKIRPTAAGYTPTTRRGRRPPDKILRRSTVKFGPRHARRPAVTRHPGKVSSRSGRSIHENRSGRSHVRSRDRGLPKTFGPNSRQPSRRDRERPAAGRNSNGGRHSSDKNLKRSTERFKPRHVQRPEVTRHPDNLRGRSGRSIHENRSDRSHVRSRDRGLPKTFGPNKWQPSRHDRERPAAGRDSNSGRRRVNAKSHRTPAINRPSTRHVNPGNRRPANQVKPPRRSDDVRAARRTTIKNDRSRSVERPSHFYRAPQRRQGRVAASAPRPQVRHPEANAMRRAPNHPAVSLPQIQSNRSRPEAPQVYRSSPNASRHRRDSGFRASPRISNPSQNRIGSSRGLQRGGSDRWQFRSNRNSSGGSGHRFQGRIRN